MSRLHEPIQDHIHRETCSEVNKMIIALKVHSGEIYDNQTEEQQRKIDQVRGIHKRPTTQDIIDLLAKVRDEMDECKIPFKRF